MTSTQPLQITREQADRFRLRVNHLLDRLPPGSYGEAAYVGLQDSAPRDAVLGLHARMVGCRPTDWSVPALIQTYSPRNAVYVLPTEDFGLFTLGTLPIDPEAAARIDELADSVCRELDGQERRAGDLPGLRVACASGRIALRWTTHSLWVREVERPSLDPDRARTELARRHIRRFAPATPRTLAWWTGLSAADARTVWVGVADELTEVDIEGTRAWIHQADEDAFRRDESIEGIRLLVAPDLRLLGRERSGRFVGPGTRVMTAAADTFHPNGVLVDGRIVGAWGRKRNRVDIVLTERLSNPATESLHAEAAAFPIEGAPMIIDIRRMS